MPMPHDLTTHSEAVSSLVPWSKNPRINDAAAKRLARSIEAHGWTVPILAQRGSRRVIAGHTRLKAAAILGLEHVPVIWLDVDDRQADRLALADNRLGELAEWENDGLAAMLREMEAEGDDLSLLGWDDLTDFDALVDPPMPSDEAPPMPVEPDSERGAVYELGPHRLVCGDSTDAAVWTVLLGSERGHVVLTDPPYGVGLDYSEHNDTLEALRSLAAGWLPLALASAPAVVFSPGVTRQWVYPEPQWVLCWFYGAAVICSSWGFSCWQPFLCYGKDPSLATGQGRRPDAVNLNAPANAADIAHPCPKPLALWLWLLDRLVVPRGGIVIDPFGGSGTTLMACAAIGATARLIELDPAYCDVIRRRWTAYADEHGLEAGTGALRDADPR